MQTRFGWAGPRTAAIALVLSGLFGHLNLTVADEIETTADAGAPSPADRPLIRFNTVGTLTVDQQTVEGENVIGFNNILNQGFSAPSFVSLGEIQVIPGLGDAVTATYNDTPFILTLGVEQVNGTTPDPNETPIVLTGRINGTITGSTQSNATLTWDLDPMDLPSFQIGDYVATITKLDPVDIAPFTTNGGRTSIQGRIEATQVPEPASIAVFLAALAGGYGLRRRALAARPVA